MTRDAKARQQIDERLTQVGWVTAEQTEWLRLMKDRIASSCSISGDDFDYARLADKGGLQKVWTVFGADLDGLLGEINMELVA